MKLKRAALLEIGAFLLIGAGLACFEKSVRAVVAAESSADSWDRALADEDLITPESSLHGTPANGE